MKRKSGTGKGRSSGLVVTGRKIRLEVTLFTAHKRSQESLNSVGGKGGREGYREGSKWRQGSKAIFLLLIVVQLLLLL